MIKQFSKDYYRATGKQWKPYKIISLRKSVALRYLFYYRMAQNSQIYLLRWWAGGVLSRMSKQYGIGIPSDCQIDEGLVIGHACCIAINSKTIMGKNCYISKGITIGKDFRGCRKGAPIIGDYVFVGAGAAIVGKIRVGDDVVIAPNAFVNIDIPSHSIVVGNPCKIYKKEFATEGFLHNLEYNFCAMN